ncbi:tRNA pseudouridine synthase A [Anaerohalosphaera lusitana]|uniref:tRNA pseudouridine synthase A n=1 Tax=Anaerohalosphaera lusitana TaxID=1936003 RepID=A0A1U9NQI3_9BACT|nr:tRNA pseudouridine(38-40) synthase TruA [Anaerohalosphaera lusitana]AQT70193.1 tRNA pseudouridine synthase A [Anaerohalosphaera lusitana]
MAKRNVKLVIQYDGSAYHGWAKQPGAATVQDTCQRAIKKLVGEDVRVHLVGASRTDAGVSALGQVANMKIDTVVPTANFRRALNNILPDDIAILEAVDAPDKFSAITNAVRKHYRYTIYTGSVRPVLHIKHCWHYHADLDIDAMNAAAEHIVGKNDFKSFSSSGDHRKNHVRTVFRCEVTEDGDWVYIDVEGDGFVYNMVRIIAGTLVEVGRGRWQADRVKDIVAACDRTKAGPLAPGSGLCLMRIDFDM